MPQETPKALLLDIEGTAGDASFVHDVLFPYFLVHFRGWLKANWQSKQGLEVLEAFRSQSLKDKMVPSLPKDGLTGIHSIPPMDVESGFITDMLDMVANNASIYVQMDVEKMRKTPCLKLAQEYVWLKGYESGELKQQP